MTTSDSSARSPRLGGHLLVDQLRLHGADHVFCVPGESYLAVLDGLVDSGMQVTVCRQEGGAAMMADAYGKLTGRPGICMVTRGPGASNAMAGVHIASQDSTPMILLVGQVERGMLEREAFQEMDYKAVFGTQAKWVAQIDQVERIPEMMARAFHVAASGRPGPVVLALPEDMLTDSTDAPDARPMTPLGIHPSPEQLQAMRQMLDKARQPVFILGGGAWDEEAVLSLERIAGRHAAAVCVEFRRQMLFSTRHDCFIGDLGLGANPDLLDYLRQADLIVLLGGRLPEVPSQSYTLLGIPQAGTPLIHVHPDSAELNRVYQADLAINSTPRDFVRALAQDPPAPRQAGPALQAMRQSYLRWSDPSGIRVPGALQMGRIMAHLADTLPAHAILCNGAGNYATWVHRFHPFQRYGTQLAPTSGSMGYGLPAAVAAKRLQPDTPVLCFAGDGCFMMHGQEFATAVQYGLLIVVIVIDNGMYGTIRMHQERQYPGRESATALRNPDFAALAQAYGGWGETVLDSEEFPAALERAQASGLPALIHCLLDPQAISPSTTLDAIRTRAEQARRSDSL